MCNYINLIRKRHSLPMEDAEIAHVEEVLQTDLEGDDSDIVCVKCLSGEVSDGNDILICDRDHSSTVGYHQQCFAPLIAQVPKHSWFCRACVAQGSTGDSRLADGDYVPSTHDCASSSHVTFASISDGTSSYDIDT